MTLNCISWERSSITASCDANVISADVTPRCGLLLQMGEQKEVDGVGMLFITLKADSNEKMSPVYSENATNRLYTVQAEPAGWKQAVTRDGERSFKKKKKSSDGAKHVSVAPKKQKTKQNQTKNMKHPEMKCHCALSGIGDPRLDGPNPASVVRASQLLMKRARD